MADPQKEQTGIFRQIVSSLGGIASAIQQVASFLRAQTLSHAHTGGTDGQQLTNAAIASNAAIAASKLAFSGCSLYKSVNEAYASGAWANLLFDSESFDTDSYHSTVANTQRITVSATGYYFFFATVQYANNATGFRAIRFDKNNGTYYFKKSHNSNDGGTVNGYLSSSGIIYLTAGDYVQVNFYQDSGGNLNIIGGTAESTAFGCNFLGS